MNASVEKGFRGINITDSHRDMSVHEEVLDGSSTASGPRRHELARERRPQGLDAKMPEVPIGLQSLGRQSEYQTESPGIAKSQLAPGSEEDNNVFVSLAWLARFHESQSTTHPQVHDESRVPFDME
jgi:hypothetical protein